MKLPYNHIEITRTTTSAGIFTRWVVVFNDLYFGRRQLAQFYTKREAVEAAQRLAREKRVPFGRRQARRAGPQRPRRAPTKREQFEQRQRLVAQRAAKQRSEP